MSKNSSGKGHGFGTAPVFLAAISTILGAILFLRFGYAVANSGLIGTLVIILVGHMITIPTALAIAEIATNLKVQGGGEYFIISRSFGSIIGGTIGISLYFSQAISVAFYLIAFSEAFKPFLAIFEQIVGFPIQIWMISLPATLILLIVIVFKGASIGVNVLWIVVGILAVSLVMFFAGEPVVEKSYQDLLQKVDDPDGIFIVFAIIFPAFTGMTAGVGLSGDLKNPKKSIPLGTLSATLVGMIVYVLVVIKLANSLPVDVLAKDQFAMSRIAVWGPIIPIGLAAASSSSAIGSVLIAPRTMQAIAKDQILPLRKLNSFLSRGRGDANEPINATLITSLIILTFVSIGSVDFVARIISMFFMITYGTLCLVSFLEHFSGNPSYRPTFKSKWYLSLIGSVACFIMMFQMAPGYAFLAVLAMSGIYWTIRRSRNEQGDLSIMVRGALFQLTRKLKIFIQRKHEDTSITRNWRPSFIAISSDSFSRLSQFDLLRWISHVYGFGTFFHFIKGPLDKNTNIESKEILDKLISQAAVSKSSVFVDTIISPSFKTAVAQVVQIPGISGMENNGIIFEFEGDNPSGISDIIEGCNFASFVDFNLCVLRSSERHFGYKKNIHVWLTPGDLRNANLMILLAYILLGHPEWDGGEIDLYVAFEKKELNKEVVRLNRLIDRGRIPISHKKVKRIPWNKRAKSFEALVLENSNVADLVIMGFSVSKLQEDKGSYFKRFDTINDVLFVSAGQQIAISDTEYRLD
jgi:amino acid transporter